jgi:hypothetical protein
MVTVGEEKLVKQVKACEFHTSPLLRYFSLQESERERERAVTRYFV